MESLIDIEALVNVADEVLGNIDFFNAGAPAENVVAAVEMAKEIESVDEL